jgi:hypothetical protein
MRRMTIRRAGGPLQASRVALAAWIGGAAAALLVTPGCSGRTAPAATVAAATALQFIADDFPRAQDEAKRRSVPIFVEAWAPW